MKISNIASVSSVSEYIEVLTPIKKPTLRLEYTGSADRIMFGTNIVYIIDMEAGSNVLVKAFYGDERNLEIPTTVKHLNGSWQGPMRFEHSQSIPGQFTVTFTVSNAAETFTLTKTIYVYTSCKGLLLGLRQSPVVYKPTGGLANFQFYYGLIKAGANCKVTLWPGDGSQYGPFEINVDFYGNFTKNAISYRYSSAGTYNVKFFAENIIDSETYVMTVDVLPAVYGLVLETSPSNGRIALGSQFTVSAYLIQGCPTKTYYDWMFNGETQTTTRSGKF